MTSAPIPSAAVLTIEGVEKRFDDTVALAGVSLTVRRGELLAVVGPSGCGKSTLLRVVAGLTPLDAGRITIDGLEVAGPSTWVPPERRQVGVVFQDHALFPHLTVAGNVAFGLVDGRPPSGRGDQPWRSSRWPRRSGSRGIDARVTEVLELVGLSHLSMRYPHELSGGEQQRVALARALAPRPAVVMLDEPFSSLDSNLRVRVREETLAVLRTAGTTAVFVTHDQEEALAVGDRIAVLRAGRIEQLNEPKVVFHRPVNRFVAAFMGEADLVPGQQHGQTAETAVGPLAVTSAALDGPVEVMVRPHEVQLLVDSRGNGVVQRTDFRGGFVAHHVALDDGTQLRSLRAHTDVVEIGTRVQVQVVAGHPLAVFPTEKPTRSRMSPPTDRTTVADGDGLGSTDGWSPNVQNAPSR